VRATLFDAVLFDRDGTLVVDVPYNGDPDALRPVPGARAALDRLRAANLRIGVVTNQSGVGAGRFTGADLRRVHDRLVDLLGPIHTVQVCPHRPEEGCDCRKPAPGLVYRAARALGTAPSRCVVVGDIHRDMAAAGAAGAAAIMVPTVATRPDEIAAAPAVAGDLAGVVNLILRRQRLVSGGGDRHRAAGRSEWPPRSRPAGRSEWPPRSRPAGRVLVVRSDSSGDVLLAGPAVRAVAASAEQVVLLCGPRGRAAAELLPGVDQVVEFELPWIEPDPRPVDPAAQRALVAHIAALAIDEALVLTSFHQSALPLALLLRMAGVPRISAISDDYPGSLLDVRHQVPLGIPEPERMMSLAAAAGFPPPAGDDGTLALRPDRLTAAAADLDPYLAPPDRSGYVVMHPGSSVAARACPPQRCGQIVAALAAAGHRVVVTGGPGERTLSGYVAGRVARDLGGRTSLAALAVLLARAECLVVGNTGPAHLAASVGTPVVSLFAPTVSFGQWGPYRVPWVRLGDPVAGCRHSRASRCPVPGHPCLSAVEPAQVVAAVERLRAGAATADRPVSPAVTGGVGGPR
jgi:histidinol-phosphate phosphatase family protein